MKNLATVHYLSMVLPVLLFCVACSWCQEFLDRREIIQIEKIIRANQFYPPLSEFSGNQQLKPLVFGLIN